MTITTCAETTGSRLTLSHPLPEGEPERYDFYIVLRDEAGWFMHNGKREHWTYILGRYDNSREAYKYRDEIQKFIPVHVRNFFISTNPIYLELARLTKIKRD